MPDAPSTMPERAAPDVAQPVRLADVKAALERAEREVGAAIDAANVERKALGYDAERGYSPAFEVARREVGGRGAPSDLLVQVVGAVPPRARVPRRRGRRSWRPPYWS